MTGFLIVGGMILLLVLALGPAHRRARIAWHPGRDDREDRDLARLRAELRAIPDDPGPTAPRSPATPNDGPATRGDTALAA